MKRLFAVVGLAAFIAACSDSNVTSPVSGAQPHGPSLAVGNPPPPPLSGSGGFADLDVFGSDLSALAVTSNSILACGGHGFSLNNFTFTYLLNKPGTNEVARLHMGGTNGGATGDIDIHQNINGGSNANGAVSQDGFTFKFQSGNGGIDPTFDDGGNVNGLTFDFSLTGVLTDPNGGQCTLSANLTTNSG